MDLMDYLEYTDKSVDIILLDMIMPDIEGVEIVKQLREQSRYKKTPIILQTGIKYDSDLIELQKFYPLGYISKPYNKQELQEEIEKYLISEKQ
jgi:CheY-like chemotaxis protein